MTSTQNEGDAIKLPESSAKHTPGPWKQGYTLSTPQTQRWTKEEWDANQEREQRMVFVDFTMSDQGRGRRRIAVCETKEDARLIAAAPELLVALRDCKNAIESGQLSSDRRGTIYTQEFGQAFLEYINAAICKATGANPIASLAP